MRLGFTLIRAPVRPDAAGFGAPVGPQPAWRVPAGRSAVSGEVLDRRGPPVRFDHLFGRPDHFQSAPRGRGRRSGDGPRFSGVQAIVRTARPARRPRGVRHDEETLDRVVWLDPRRDRSRSLSFRKRAAGRRNAPIRRSPGVPLIWPHADLWRRRPPVDRAGRLSAAGRGRAQGRSRGRDAAQRARVCGRVRRGREDRRDPGQREPALRRAKPSISSTTRASRSRWCAAGRWARSPRWSAARACAPC